jgi:hypothetical protein
MASVDGTLAESPLKVRATEIIDLSEDSSVDQLIGAIERKGERDALTNIDTDLSEEEDDDDQWSLYEDALEGMGDEESLDGSVYPFSNVNSINY